MNKKIKKLFGVGLSLVIIGGAILFIAPKNIEIKSEAEIVDELEEVSEGKKAFKGMEVYIFKEGENEKYLLKSGTNYNPSKDELLAFEGWSEDFDSVLEAIEDYEKDTYVFIYYDNTIEKDLLLEIKDKISKSIDSENISIMESVDKVGEIEIQIVQPD